MTCPSCGGDAATIMQHHQGVNGELVLELLCRLCGHGWRTQKTLERACPFCHQKWNELVPYRCKPGEERPAHR